MEPEVAITGVIRLVNATLWTVLAIQIWRAHAPLLDLARQMVMPVLVIGMWALVVGWLATAGILPLWSTRNAYTVYATFAALIALVLVISGIHEDDDDPD